MSHRETPESLTHIDPRGCPCPLCGVSRSVKAMRSALDELDAAREIDGNNREELGMSHAYLVDEVEAVLALPWWRRSRKRLARALEIARSGVVS